MNDDWGPSTYGDRFAPVYDEWYEHRFDTEGAVALLAELAGDGPVLELGVGTGRLALPLAALGLDVDGIDASQAMTDRLLAKPGGERVRVVLGDMADVATLTDTDYSLVFIAFSTIFTLLDPDVLARCFHGVRARLRPGGRFVVETFVPDPDRLSVADSVRVRSIEPDRLVLEAAKSDVAGQRIDAMIAVLTEAGTKLYPLRVRWAGTDELDRLADAAGFAVEDRWSTWRQDPFTDESANQITVYRVLR